MFKNIIEYSKTLKRIDPIKKHGDFQALMEVTSFLPETVGLRQRIWHVEYNVHEIPLCAHCGKVHVNWRMVEYVKYCSMKCLSNSDEVKDKRKNTLIERFGVDNPMKSEAIMDGIKKNNLEKFGVEYSLQRRDVIEAREKTNLVKYGNICSLHGESVSALVKENNLKKYGKEYPSQTDEFKQRVRETNLKLCGKEYHTQVHISDKNIKLLNSEEYLRTEHLDNMKSASMIGVELGVTPRTVLMKFEEFGIKLQHFFRSDIEKEVCAFIAEVTGFEIDTNNRDIISKELDIVLPEINMAIEVNGNYFHSELNGKGRSYHNDKFNECAKNGYELVHLLESDWKASKNVVKSLLLVKFGKSPRKLDARKCSVLDIKSNQARQFFVDNHLHGYVNSSVHKALYYGDELVSVMSFSRNRFGKNEEYEMTRFASKLNTNVRGAAGRLFKAFIRENDPLSVVSYAQRGMFTGKVYEKLGFVFSHVSQPNYQYFHTSNPLKLFSRIKFQKHKLAKELETFDPLLSAWSNMQANGYDRIWDCGNNVYMFNR